MSTRSSIHGEKGLVFGAQTRYGRSDMTVAKVAATAAADGEWVECGYEPELKQILGSFQMWTVNREVLDTELGVDIFAVAPETTA